VFFVTITTIYIILVPVNLNQNVKRKKKEIKTLQLIWLKQVRRRSRISAKSHFERLFCNRSRRAENLKSPQKNIVSSFFQQVSTRTTFQKNNAPIWSRRQFDADISKCRFLERGRSVFGKSRLLIFQSENF